MKNVKRKTYKQIEEPGSGIRHSWGTDIYVRRFIFWKRVHSYQVFEFWNGVREFWYMGPGPDKYYRDGKEINWMDSEINRDIRRINREFDELIEKHYKLIKENDEKMEAHRQWMKDFEAKDKVTHY